MTYPPPHFFASAHSKGLTKAFFGSAHSKGVTDGQLRPKPGKTRYLSRTAHSKGLRSEMVGRLEGLKVAGSEGKRESPHAPASKGLAGAERA
jgi:hypothetical protein